jgi:hypothetical protein
VTDNDQGQCCTRNLERTDIQEETSGKTRRHQCNKELRLKEATSEEGGTFGRLSRKTIGLENVK